jgi:hypothetical protein
MHGFGSSRKMIVEGGAAAVGALLWATCRWPAPRRRHFPRNVDLDENLSLLRP